MKIIIFIGALLMGPLVQAQESVRETQAIRCAAISLVHTSVSAPDPGFGRAMTAGTTLFGSAFSSIGFFRTGSRMTNGQVAARQELVLDEFKKSWQSNPEAVVREAALCGTWLDLIRKRLAPMKGVTRIIESDRDVVEVVGDIPTTVTAEDLGTWRTVVPVAFDAWAKLNYASPASLGKQVQESLRAKPD